MSDSEACQNTDREIWRGPDEGNGNYYADSIFITKEDALGINCSGSVHVRPIREWHRLAGGPIAGLPKPDAEYFAPRPTEQLTTTGYDAMPKIELSDDEIFTLQSAVEHLRGGIPDNPESKERRADAAFRIASRLEQIAKRAVSRS